MAPVKKTSPKNSSSVTDPSSSESVSLDLTALPEGDGGCDEIPDSTGPIYVQADGSIKVEPVAAYKGRQEAVLRKMGIEPIAAAVAGITFENEVPTPAPRFEGGLYHPPGLNASLQFEDRLFVATTSLDAIAADAHGLACVSLALASTDSPETLLKLLGDRSLVLVRDASQGPGNDALRQLEKTVRTKAPDVTMVVVTCPSADTFKLKEGEKVTFGVWLKHRTATVVSSAIARKVRDRKDEISPSRIGGGFVALGYTGKNCTVFSLSRNKIIDLSATELKNPMSLGQAVGAKFIRSNYLRVSAETKAETVDTLSLGLDIVGKCDELGDFRSEYVYGAGVWRNSQGELIVNSKIAFHPNGDLAKRLDGDSIYIASRDLGIRPDTPECTKEEAIEAFKFYDNYNYEKAGAALIVFGHVVNTYTCGANDWRQWLLLTGMPGGGKSSVMLFSKSLLGDACDMMIGGSEAGMRHGGGMDSLGLFFDEAEEDEDNKAEFRKILSNLRKSAKGGIENRGSREGVRVQHAIKSQAMLAANKFPELRGADVTRMVPVKMLETAKGQFKKHSWVPRPLAHRFPEVEVMGRKLFMRMLRSNGRYLQNLAVIKEAMETESVRAATTLSASIAASFTAMHDDVLTPETALAWLANFDLTTTISDIEAAQISTGIIEFLSSKPVPANRLAPGSNPCQISDLWMIARHGDGAGQANAIGALAVMGMRALPGNTRRSIEVRFFPQRAGLKELFKNTEWQNEDLTKALLNDPRTDNALSNRTSELRVASARLTAKGGIAFQASDNDAKRITGERYVSLEWEPVNLAEEAELEYNASVSLWGEPAPEENDDDEGSTAVTPSAAVASVDVISVIEKVTAAV